MRRKLVLSDGSIFEGAPLGADCPAIGEVVFNTGMTGYQEIFTDPSYFGQLLVATNVHIGNYGIKNGEAESEKMKIAGLICKTFNVDFSRASADQNIQDYFDTEGVVGISDVDTRSIVRHIRDKGAMNAIISSEILDEEELQMLLNGVPSMDGLELSSVVTTEQPYFFGNENATYRIAALDFGINEAF